MLNLVQLTQVVVMLTSGRLTRLMRHRTLVTVTKLTREQPNGHLRERTMLNS